MLLPLMIGGMIVTTNTSDDVERDVGSLTSSDTATDHHHDHLVRAQWLRIGHCD
jgi:hypothetical protein